MKFNANNMLHCPQEKLAFQQQLVNDKNSRYVIIINNNCKKSAN